MSLSVPEARAQLAQRLAESITGHDKLGIPGFELLDERVRSLEQAINGLIVAHICTLTLQQAAREPTCTSSA